MILPIFTIPNPVLRQRAGEVEPPEIKSSVVQKLIFDMKETVSPVGGIGLAAPQVGFSLRIVVIALEDKMAVLINPEIIKFSWRKETAGEGCLSVPQKFGQVKRSKVIKVVAFDEKGVVVKFRAKDLFARVIQHEVDHLNGILFIDRAKKIVADNISKI